MLTLLNFSIFSEVNSLTCSDILRINSVISVTDGLAKVIVSSKSHIFLSIVISVLINANAIIISAIKTIVIKKVYSCIKRKCIKQ